MLKYRDLNISKTSNERVIYFRILVEAKDSLLFPFKEGAY